MILTCFFFVCLDRWCSSQNHRNRTICLNHRKILLLNQILVLTT
jgi:hypothetical protein